MKTLTHLQKTFVFWFLLIEMPMCARSDQVTNRISESFYGETINGFRGEIELISLNGQPVELAVLVNQVSDTNNSVAHLDFKHESAILNRMITNDWDYWMATNSFCGPIEIHDVLGRNLSSLKPDASRLTNYLGMELPLTPDVTTTNAYPFNYNLETEHGRHFLQFRHGYSGPGIFPVALFFPSPRSELVRFRIQSPQMPNGRLQVPTILNRVFHLEDYFELRESGEYTFTVWPKIYKRVSSTNDLCERVDIPPVSVRVKISATNGLLHMPTRSREW